VEMGRQESKAVSKGGMPRGDWAGWGTALVAVAMSSPPEGTAASSRMQAGMACGRQEGGWSDHGWQTAARSLLGQAAAKQQSAAAAARRRTRWRSPTARQACGLCASPARRRRLEQPRLRGHMAGRVQVGRQSEQSRGPAGATAASRVPATGNAREPATVPTPPRAAWTGAVARTIPARPLEWPACRLGVCTTGGWRWSRGNARNSPVEASWTGDSGIGRDARPCVRLEARRGGRRAAWSALVFGSSLGGLPCPCPSSIHSRAEGSPALAGSQGHAGRLVVVLPLAALCLVAGALVYWSSAEQSGAADEEAGGDDAGADRPGWGSPDAESSKERLSGLDQPEPDSKG
jgi:hypothetical protein